MTLLEYRQKIFYTINYSTKVVDNLDYVGEKIANLVKRTHLLTNPIKTLGFSPLNFVGLVWIQSSEQFVIPVSLELYLESYRQVPEQSVNLAFASNINSTARSNSL